MTGKPAWARATRGAGCHASRGSAARIKVGASGTVVVYVNQAGQGQGHATALPGGSGSDQCRLRGRFRDREGDTEVVPFGTGIRRRIVLAGGAVAKAASRCVTRCVSRRAVDRARTSKSRMAWLV